MVIYTFGTGELAPYSRFLRGTNLGALIRWIGALEKTQYLQVVETMEQFEYGGQSRPRGSMELSRSLPAFGMSRMAIWKTEKQQGINPEMSTTYHPRPEQELRRRDRHKRIHIRPLTPFTRLLIWTFSTSSILASLSDLLIWSMSPCQHTGPKVISHNVARPRHLIKWIGATGTLSGLTAH
jgi:hypothetical protein